MSGMLFLRHSVCTYHSIIRRHCSSASNSAYPYKFFRSMVCLSTCRLSHYCLSHSTNLHASRLVDTIVSIVLNGGLYLHPQWKGKFGGQTPKPKHAIANCCCRLADRNKELFHFFPNYYGLPVNSCNCQLHFQRTYEEYKYKSETICCCCSCCCCSAAAAAATTTTVV